MKQIQYIPLVAVTLSLLAGCATSNRQAGKNITATPGFHTLTPDSLYRVDMDLVFHIPEHYFSKRSRLVIVPQLVADGTVKEEYAPLVLDAPIYDKKVYRKKILHGYEDPYEGKATKADKTSHAFELPYRETVELPEGVEEGRFVAVVSTDGCGQCSGIDTLEIAAISNPVTLMEDLKESLELSWIEPEFVIRPKIIEGKGVANLQFGINRSDINLSMGNNQKELDGMVKTLAPVFSDTLATVNGITITGMASADGSLALNTALARNRANAAKEWLTCQLGIKPEMQRRITTGSRPEGWEPVLAAMTAAGNPDSAAVKNILVKYNGSNDDVQEQYIRRLSCWNDIKNNYLQKDRKVEYVYTYTLKSFTSDSELLDMYSKRPDAFNEDELLRVAALTPSAEGKKEVYGTIINYFPQSQVAVNNLAVLHLREGNTQKAKEVLNTLTEYAPETLNTLAASYIYADDYEKAIELLQDTELPVARYNLGLLKAKKRQFGEAYELLRPFADLNSAIVALSVNRNSEADRILSALDNSQPVAEYARSLVAARLENDTTFYKHIPNACTDPALRKRATGEPDFFRYRREEPFRALVNQR